jgi:hypothetical protein
MRSAFSSRDAELLSQLAWDGVRLRSADLAASAVELFSREGATDESRWLGLTVALTQSTRPISLDFDLERLLREAPSFSRGELACFGVGTPVSAISVEPPSVAFDTLLADRIRAVRLRPGGSPFVRGLLNCLWAHLRYIQPVLQPGQIAAENECDNRWFLTSSYADDAVIVEVGPADVPGERRVQVGPDGKAFFQMPFASDIVVRNRGSVILRATHAHVSCMAKRFRDAGAPIPADHDTLSGWQWRSIRPER